MSNRCASALIQAILLSTCSQDTAYFFSEIALLAIHNTYTFTTDIWDIWFTKPSQRHWTNSAIYSTNWQKTTSSKSPAHLNVNGILCRCIYWTVESKADKKYLPVHHESNINSFCKYTAGQQWRENVVIVAYLMVKSSQHRQITCTTVKVWVTQWRYGIKRLQVRLPCQSCASVIKQYKLVQV